ncbi:MAG: 50S ribosomal protein L9 [Candidatus Adiutrix sp.]|jgi:large subunit ribosomal protein L9|nr:50S ribosomal protein L9 [Candidatus Adiutrix sp.]
MEIILIKDIDNLGLSGQVLKVAPGYARNFLLPAGAALPATPGNLKMLARKRAEFEARAKADKERALDLKTKLAGLKIVFARKAGEKDKLYGAVTTADIAQAVDGQGLAIDRRKLRLTEPIKTLGDHEVSVRLHPEVLAVFKVTVVSEDGGEAAPA